VTPPIPDPDGGAVAPGAPNAVSRRVPRRLRAAARSAFFVIAAATAAIGAVVVLASGALEGSARAITAGTFGGVALLALLGLAAPARHAGHAMLALLSTAVVAIGAHAVWIGWGLRAPGLWFGGLLVCALCVTGQPRRGIALTVLATIVVVAVAAFESAGGPVPGALILAAHLMLLGAGLATGLVLTDVQRRFVSAADERDRRFSGLLAIAADAYWEIDAQSRLVAVEHPRDPRFTMHPGEGLGHCPWDLEAFRCTPEALDALRADIESRLPLREALIEWVLDDGRVRQLNVSGEPRHDERGVFLGYWGVARDVTDALAAQRALSASETRYEELFARIPTPLVLHRGGRIVDANPAGVALLGHAAVADLAGTDLLQHFASGDSRERARRAVEAMESQAPGAADPVADYRLEARGGRRVVVRASAVRVEAGGEPATLTIFVDDTQRRAAEEAVRRSEAMLSHLVATSPDVITLTDLATGRYAMVNRTFERLTGYVAAEVIGRTSLELGIWADAGDREAFVATLREQGAVQDRLTRFVTKGGQAIPMLVSGARFTMDRREYLVINARDMTEVERDRLEREAILENVSIGIAVTRQRRFVLVNPAFEQMYGWPRGALAGQGGDIVWPDAEAYAEIGREIGPRLARGETVEIERMARRRDGGGFVARIIARPIDPRLPADGGTVWIVEDFTARRQFEQQLARARDEAEAASRAKSSFLANTSHELRTPLNGIIGLAQLARGTDVDEERRHQYLDQILESTRTLADIISDILDLSKIEAGQLHLEDTDFDLGALLRSLQRTHAALTAGRRLRLAVETGPGVDGPVRGDALRVRQILANYLSNALKFTEHGEVRLRATRRGERVRFEVHDTGPGVPAEVQPRLFKPFSQADSSTTRRFGGTGLGLSICRELAALMGGEVGMTSEAGRGSVFWAELPLPASDAPAQPAEGPADAAAELHGARVLLAEDNPVNMLIAAALLERWGVVVVQAADGRQAVDAVQRAHAEGHPFDAVLMDVQMPSMSGYEATRLLRADAAGRALPIIALTAAALVSERQQALGAGMDDFLTKPIDADRLRATLARWLAERRTA
jgi:PAS domain S-box-containing protein